MLTCHQVFQVRRNINLLHFAAAVILKLVRFTAEQIYQTAESLSSSYGKVYRGGFVAEYFFDFRNNFEEISTFTIHFVDGYKSWKIELVGKFPDLLCLHLYTVDGVNHYHSPVDSVETSLGVHQKVEITRGINDGDG